MLVLGISQYWVIVYGLRPQPSDRKPVDCHSTYSLKLILKKVTFT